MMFHYFYRFVDQCLRRGAISPGMWWLWALTVLPAGCLVLNGAPEGSPFGLIENRWENEVFRARFLGTYGFDGAKEPSITREEQGVLQGLIPLMEKDQYAAAASRLLAAIREDSSAALDYTLGNIYFQSGQLAPAEKAYQEALRKFPDFQRAYRNLALVYLQQGRVEEAFPLLVQALEKGGADGDLYGLMAYCHLVSGNASSALSGYDLALFYRPDNVDWQLGKAQALNALERHRDAIGLVEEVLRRYPDRSDLWLFQANLYLADQQRDKAAANLEILRRKGECTPAGLVLLGNIYLNEGLSNLALEVYQEALQGKEKPELASMIRSLEGLILRQELAKARTLLEKIRVAYDKPWLPRDEVALLNLEARLLLAEGDGDRAVRTLQGILDRNPLDGQALLLLATYHAGRGEREEAEFLYERASYIPEYQVDAYVQHARLLVREQEYEKALSLLQRAQQIRHQDHIDRYIQSIRQAAGLYP